MHQIYLRKKPTLTHEHFGFFLGAFYVLKKVSSFLKSTSLKQNAILCICHCIASPMRGYAIGRVIIKLLFIVCLLLGLRSSLLTLRCKVNTFYKTMQELLIIMMSNRIKTKHISNKPFYGNKRGRGGLCLHAVPTLTTIVRTREMLGSLRVFTQP